MQLVNFGHLRVIIVLSCVISFAKQCSWFVDVVDYHRCRLFMVDWLIYVTIVPCLCVF